MMRQPAKRTVLKVDGWSLATESSRNYVDLTRLSMARRGRARLRKSSSFCLCLDEQEGCHLTNGAEICCTIAYLVKFHLNKWSFNDHILSNTIPLNLYRRDISYLMDGTTIAIKLMLLYPTIFYYLSGNFRANMYTPGSENLVVISTWPNKIHLTLGAIWEGERQAMIHAYPLKKKEIKNHDQ